MEAYCMRRPGSEIRDRASSTRIRNWRNPRATPRCWRVVVALFATCNTRDGAKWPRGFPECETHTHVRVHTCVAACRRSARCKCATGAPDCLIAPREREGDFDEQRGQNPCSFKHDDARLSLFLTASSHSFFLWLSVYLSVRFCLFLTHYIFLIPGVPRPADVARLIRAYVKCVGAHTNKYVH